MLDYPIVEAVEMWETRSATGLGWDDQAGAMAGNFKEAIKLERRAYC